MRRGASLDTIDLDACRAYGIAVRNAPGVNAPHVADHIVSRLRDCSGKLPRDIRLLGCGNVGQQVAVKLLDADPSVTLTILVRDGKTLAALGLQPYEDRVSLVCDTAFALGGASSVVVCLPVNDDTRSSIDGRHIDGLDPGAQIVCVSKPDVFSDAALASLSQRPGVALEVDYGAATLDAFRLRALALGCPMSEWRKVPLLTTQAATAPACQRDLDYAVAVRLAHAALDRFVASTLSCSFEIPAVPAPVGAPHVVVVGRGINGLSQALLLRLAGCHVTVHGGNDEADGASHKPVNMRHLSATETTAKPVSNGHLLAGNAELVIASNRAGIELFRKLLEDNPALEAMVSEGLVRAYPDGVGDHRQGIALQRRISQQDWPSGRKGSDADEITAEEFDRTHRVPHIAAAIKVPGYDLEFRKFMDALVAMLKQAGVVFTGRRVTTEDLSRMSAEGQTVVTAMGIADDGIVPVGGWFLTMPAVGGEAGGVRGLKLQYDLPVGVMNCRRDGGNILISGGQVPEGTSDEEAENVKTLFLTAVARHFPQSFRAAQAAGPLTLTPCTRPGSKDGLSKVEWTAPDRIMAGATYAGGTTQSLFWAALVRFEVMRRWSHPQTTKSNLPSL